MLLKTDASTGRPQEYTLDTLADGSLRVAEGRRRRSRYSWLFLLLGSAWFCVTVTIMGGGGVYPVEGPGFQWRRVWAVFASDGAVGYGPFLLLGIVFVASALFAFLSSEEWRVQSGRLEERWLALGWCYYTRRYMAGRLLVEWHEIRDSEARNRVSGHEWLLLVREGERRAVLAWSYRGPDEIVALAKTVAGWSGWELAELPERPDAA